MGRSGVQEKHPGELVELLRLFKTLDPTTISVEQVKQKAQWASNAMLQELVGTSRKTGRWTVPERTELRLASLSLREYEKKGWVTTSISNPCRCKDIWDDTIEGELVVDVAYWLDIRSTIS
ncbi:MAG: hypothetical protein AAGF93_23350 [Cyanobacteria bacterium P01_H01_bin.105]